MLLLLGDGIKRPFGALAGGREVAEASDKAVGKTHGRSGERCLGVPGDQRLLTVTSKSRAQLQLARVLGGSSYCSPTPKPASPTSSQQAAVSSPPAAEVGSLMPLLGWKRDPVSRVPQP